MKEIIVSQKIIFFGFNVLAGNKSSIVTKNGIKYVKLTFNKNFNILNRVVFLIQAIVLTVLNLLFGLLTSKIRLLWSESITGKETVVILTPFFNKKNENIYSSRDLFIEISPGIDSHSVGNAQSYPNTFPNSCNDTINLQSMNAITNERILLETYPGNNAETSSHANTESPVARLYQQYKEIEHILQRESGEMPMAKFLLFIQSCLNLYREDPIWSSFINAWQNYETSHKEPWRTSSLFYQAVSLLKDYKVAIHPDKVHDKILANVMLENTPYFCAVRSTFPGIINKCSMLIENMKTEVYAAKGMCAAMEDENIALVLQVRHFGGNINVPYFALFDGHKGGTCSKYLKTNLSCFLTNELNTISSFDDLNIYNAIKIAFVKANTELMRSITDKSGSSAIVALLINNALWIASVGNSRALLSNCNIAVQLSEDTKPSKQQFAKGVESRGGVVISRELVSVLQKGIGGRSSKNNIRLEIARDVVATSRAFGYNFAVGLTARPIIHKFNLLAGEEKSYNLILASHGFFNVISSQEAIDHISEFNEPEEAAKHLFNEAFNRGASENVTVMVIKIT